MQIPEILGLVTQYGVTGLLAVMWYLERDERKDAQKANAEMFERTLNALNENKTTIQTLKDIFNSGRVG